MARVIADRLLTIARRRIHAAALSLAMGLGLVATPAAAQELRAWDHGDYGRLVFDWGGPLPDISLDNQGSRAVITSSQPIERDITYILQFLSEYISAARATDGGRTIILDLTGPMRIDRLRLNDRAAWDFRRDPGAVAERPPEPAPVPVPEPDAEPDPPVADSPETGIEQRPIDPPDQTGDSAGDGPAPDGASTLAEEGGAQDGGAQDGGAQDGGAAGTAPAADLPSLDGQVPVYAAPRLGYSRVVFDLPSQIPYRIESEGDLVGIVFAAEGEADVAAIDASALPEVLGAVQEVTDQGLIVALAIRPGVTVRDFAYGNRVVLDLMAPRDGYVTARAVAPDAVGGDQPAAEEAEEPDTTTPEGQAEGDEGAQPPATDGDGGEAGSPDQSGDATADQANGAMAEETTSTSVVEALRQAEADESVGNGAASPDEVTPEPAEDQTPDTDAGDSATAQSQDDGPRPQAAPAEPVDQTVLARTATFDSGAPMAMAAFVRGDALWVVFAGEAVSTGVLADQGERGFGPATVAEARGGVALRFASAGTAEPVISREGTAWTVAIPDRPLTLGDTLNIQIQPDHPDGARLFIPVDGAQGPVAFIDPAVGDVLVAMPVGEVGDGVASVQRFIEFRLLPSAQGLVIRPAADDLRVRGIDGGVVITADGGLELS